MINIIKIKEEWKLILESDLISDKNIENKQKQANENPNKSKYKYDEPVTIVGTFGIKKFETENGSARPYVITLNTPITVIANGGNDFDETETNQNLIQLALSEEQLKYLSFWQTDSSYRYIFQLTHWTSFYTCIDVCLRS